MASDVDMSFAQEELDFDSEEEDENYVPPLVKISRKRADESESSSSEDDCDDEPQRYVVLPTTSRGGQTGITTMVDAVPFSRKSASLFGKNQTEWKTTPLSTNLEPKIIRRGYGKSV